MNRRKFIVNSAKAAAAMSVPIILPSGRLFASTATHPKIKHVVFCLFAGGIRNWESIDFKEGNLMPNTLKSNSVINNDIKDGIDEMPKVSQHPLQNYGTLLKGFRYKSKVTLHYNAHAAAITGKYANTVDLMKPIASPSIFEYYRKHIGQENKALNAWWITDQLGPFPFLQYSNHSKYGLNYASNMIQPNTFFKTKFSEQLDKKQQGLLDGMLNIISSANQSTSMKKDILSLLNSEEDSDKIKKLIHDLVNSPFIDGQLWGDLNTKLINDDLVTMYTATKILTSFHPKLLVVNMQDSDVGHSNFTSYCNNMHKADYALAKLWETIQSDKVLKNNTVLIAAPEFGRNGTSNTIMDNYGRYAVDHTGDEISQQAFCLIVGPKGVIQQNKVVNETYGQTIDIVPTIAHLMGFYKQIPETLLNGEVLYEALV